MVAAGNDFLVVDTRRHPLRALAGQWGRIAHALCDRHAGVGADGVLVLESSRAATVRMRLFNPDGSEGAMCGNGARCVARAVATGARPAVVRIETAAGLVIATVRGGHVRMRLPDPTHLRSDLAVTVSGRRLRLTYLNTGVPHAVVRVGNLDRVDVPVLGRALRFHRAFGRQGANVDFIEPAEAGRLRIRTYERGVEAETLACGTGAAAAAIAHGLERAAGTARATRQLAVETRGGEVLRVSFAVETNGRGRRVTEVMLEGSARRICEGTVRWPLEAR
jgi:diaminopimelate epimerase